MIRKTIAHLRTRPHQEKRAVARLGAIIVTLTLFVAWGISFTRSIATQQFAQSINEASTAAVEMTESVMFYDANQ